MKIEVDNYPSDGSEVPQFGYDIILDGKHCLYVQMADDEAGVVEAPLIDDNGQPIFDLDGEEFAIRQRRGRVEIRPRNKLVVFTEKQRQAQIDGSPFHVSTERGFV